MINPTSEHLPNCVCCGNPVPSIDSSRYYEESGDFLGCCCPMTDEEWAREIAECTASEESGA